MGKMGMAGYTDADYFAQRERQERERAQAAQSPAVREIHATLAENYARRAAQGIFREGSPADR
jgi:hypothetical protein